MIERFLQKTKAFLGQEWNIRVRIEEKKISLAFVHLAS